MEVMPSGPLRRAFALLLLCVSATAFRVPASRYPAQLREDISILPGGRVLRPFGRQVMTGNAPFAIAVSPSGKTIVTNNIGLSSSIGIDRPSITVIVPGKKDMAWTLQDYHAEARRPDSRAWQGVTRGLVVINDNSAWVAEGDTGRVVELNLSTGSRKSAASLNSNEYSDSFTDAMTYDAERNLLLVLDQANFRVAVVDPKRGAVLASSRTGILPTALALAPGGKRLFVANAGAAPSVSIIDLADPASPKASAEVPLPDGAPSGMAVHDGKIYVSLAHRDSIAVINSQTDKLETEIPLRIPGFENYRGITPLGLTVEPKSGRLLVAEAGINAVGVIDLAAGKLLGHVSVGWFPTVLQVHDAQVYVASARGFGTGPSEAAHRIRTMGGGRQGPFSFDMGASALRRGSVSAFTIPDGPDLARQTEIVLEANGFKNPGASPPDKKLPPIRYVVLIEKGARTFDEIFGDVEKAGASGVLADPTFARYGSDGYVSGGRKLFSLHADVTPNHHEIAARWSFSDNFYADCDYASAGRHWLEGAYPDLWSATEPLYGEAGNREFSANSRAPGRRLFPRDPSTLTEMELPEAGTLYTHLERHHIEYRIFSQEADEEASDQSRASRFIEELQRDYLAPGKPLPPLLEIHLPNDTTSQPRDGSFDYRASYVADNDYALGRILDFLSHSPWWKEMAVFVTETGAGDGGDHIDSHRTILLGAGPWFRSDYVSHTNASSPALLATIYKLFNLPPLNLYDAVAGDLSDMFREVADFTPYDVQHEDSRLFDPEKLKSR
jgi:DNA-binding beta-propeller fold protein YncE